MGDVEYHLVTSWNGIHAFGESLRTERWQLDRPREIVNFNLDRNGHLFMPRATTDEITFEGEGSILAIRYINQPHQGVLVQTEQKIWFLPLGEQIPVEVATPTNPEWRIWSISGDDVCYLGYAERGPGLSGGQTWKIEADGPGIDVTEITNDVPIASYSTFYKGRRFVVRQSRDVWFSNLNDFDTFDEDNEFVIGGDYGGNALSSDPGVVKGMVSWEGMLIFFLTGSIWILTGSATENWQLRQVETTVGNLSEWSLIPTEAGVFTYGGGNQKDDGFFIFTGNTSQKVSESIDQLVPGWINGLNDIVREPRPSASYYYGKYVIALGNIDPDDPQLLVYDLKSGQWTSFDGFGRSEYEPVPNGVYFANATGDDAQLVFDFQTDAVAKFPGRPAYVTMGWHDEGNTAGLTRILAIKIAGKKAGFGNPTVTATVSVPGGPSITSSPIEITEEVFDNIIVPVNLRGNAAEIKLSITPSSDTSSVLLESFQLITSRKGEKVSRD